MEKAGENAASPEIRARLSAIVAGIKKDAAFAKVLGPTKRLTLTGQDRKLGDVLKELAEAGSIKIIPGDMDPEKRIAIDVRNLTWWEALDKTAQAAGARCRVERDEGWKDKHITLRPGSDQRFPRVYQDQFRIGVVEVKKVDLVAPGRKESVVLAIVEALHQPNLSPSEQSFREPIQVKSIQDAKGADPRVERPRWVGGLMLNSRPLGLYLDLWINADAAFPLTLEGEVDIPFAKGSREVTLKFGADEAPVVIGGVALSLAGLSQTKAGTRFKVEARADDNNPTMGSSLVRGSLVLIDGKGAKHPCREDGWGATDAESTWEYKLPADIPEPKQVQFRWVAEYHRIAIPFRLEGIDLPK